MTTSATTPGAGEGSPDTKEVDGSGDGLTGRFILSEITPEALETRLRVQEADDWSRNLGTMIAVWVKQQEGERALRNTYAKALLIGVFTELLAIFVAFFLIAAGCLKAEKWTVDAFLGFALAQTTALIVVVIRYLFPERGSDLARLMDLAAPSRRGKRPDGSSESA